MKDLTKDSIVRHILVMAGPIALGMLVQMAYQLIDIKFVSGLGDAAIAGVGTAANLGFLVMALTQVLGVGTVALISQAVGRNDKEDANIIFNQSIALASLCAILTLVFGYGCADFYLNSVAADEATKAEGKTFLFWFLPGMALQFGLVALGSALRGTGIVQPTMLVQMLTAVLNAILAPILITGWGTGYPMGVAGAGLATSISLTIGLGLLLIYFIRLEHYVVIDARQWAPQLYHWKRMLNVGLPAGGEFALMFIYLGVIYTVIGNMGSESQAGFTIGSRVMQAIFLPAMAIAFAAGPIAGQNFGARLPERVRETFIKAAIMSSILMVTITLVTQWRPELLIAGFSKEAPVIEVGATFLQLISWNFLAQGLIFTCSSMFQGLGNTRPALLSSFTRLVTFAIPTLWVATLPNFRIEHVWYLSIATVTLQALVSLFLLKVEFKRRLTPMFVALA